MRRNDVVMLKEPDMYRSYGRIVRIIGDRALWIDCGRFINFTALVDLEVVDYKGRIEWSSDGTRTYFHRGADNWPDFSRVKFERPADHFERMPSLRKLKQMASRYAGKNAWKTPLNYEHLVKENEPHRF